MKINKKAFTLVELLVVVLIIGILAAIAVPQYQKAVDKARIVRFLPVIKNIDSAQQVFKLATGEYSDDFSKLDILMPAGIISGNSNSLTYKDAYYWLYEKNSIYASDRQQRFPRLEKYYHVDYTLCWHLGDKYKKELCQTFLNVSCEEESYCKVY